MFDYEKEKQVFQKELDEGRFKIERIPNTAEDYAAEKEERDVKAFESYLASPLYQSFNAGTTK